MTNSRWKRFMTFVSLLAILAFFSGGIRVLAANVSETDSTAADSRAPEESAVSERSEISSDTPGTGSSTDAPPPEQPQTASCFSFQDGTITGFSEAYRRNPSRFSIGADLSIPAEIDGVPVTAIGPDAFSGCSSFTGVLTFPETVTTIGAGAFAGTRFSTVYLPASLVSCGQSAFDSGSMLIFPNQQLFQKFETKQITPDWKRASYPVTVTLKNVDGSQVQWKALYRFPLSYAKDRNGIWAADPSRRLPEIPEEEGYSSCRWVFDPSDADAPGVTMDSPVTGTTLCAVRSVVPPEISFSPDISAEYDGKAHSLSVTAEHPLYSPEDTAAAGSVLFYYVWSWEEDGQKQEQKGYDISSLSFTDTCDHPVSVQVQAQIKEEDGSFSLLAEEEKTWNVRITAAEPSGDNDPEKPGDSQKPDDTEEPGDSQKPDDPEKPDDTEKPGDSQKPDDTEKPSDSQKPESPPYQLEIPEQISGGKVEKKEEEAEGGRKISLRFSPDPGFVLEKALLDGEDITAKVRDHIYAFQPEQESGEGKKHTLSVSFRKMTGEELQALFDALPVLKEDGECSDDVQKAYLNAWVQYQALIPESQRLLKEGTLPVYLESLAKLPCLELNVEIDPAWKNRIFIEDPFLLLSSLSQEDAQALMDETAVRISFSLTIDPEELPEESRETLLELLENSGLVHSCRIALTKNVSGKNSSNSFPLSEPLTLRFSISEGGKPTRGYTRAFRVGILEEDSEKQTKAALLKTEAETEEEIAVKASHFPAVLALLYEDRKTEEEKPSEPESPSASQPDASSGGSSPEDHASENNSSGGNSADDHHDDEDDETYVPDYEKEFWEEVRGLIQKAKAGETVNVNAVTWDKMPENVMDALRRNPHVALIVRWDGGDPVIIPALTALAKEEGRVYYPLSYLSALYKTINAALTQPLPKPADTPQITAPAQPSPGYTPTPESMGVKRPQGSQTGGSVPSPETDESSSEPETAEETEGTIPPPSGPEDVSDSQALDTAQVSQAQKNPTVTIVLAASAALLILVLILIAVLLTLKKK